MPRCQAIHRSRPAASPTRRFCVVFPFAPAPTLFGDSGACWQRPATHHRRRHRPARPSTDPATPTRLAALGGRAACLLNGFSLSVDTFPPRHPFQVIWRWFSLTFFLSLTHRSPFFPLLGVPCRLRSLAVQRCGSGF